MADGMNELMQQTRMDDMTMMMIDNVTMDGVERVEHISVAIIESVTLHESKWNGIHLFSTFGKYFEIIRRYNYLYFRGDWEERNEYVDRHVENRFEEKELNEEERRRMMEERDERKEEENEEMEEARRRRTTGNMSDG